MDVSEEPANGQPGLKEQALPEMRGQGLQSKANGLPGDDSLFKGDSKWRSMFEAFPLGVFVTDAAGELVYVNPAAEKLVGLKGEKAPDFVFDDLVHADDRQRVFSEYMRCAGARANFESELRVVRADGSIIWLSVHAAPLTLDGCFAGHVGSVEEVSARKEAEAALLEAERAARDSEQRLQLSLNASGIGIWYWDIKNARVIWDERMYELYGVDRQSFVPSHEAFLKILHPDDLEKVSGGVDSALKDSAEFSGEYRVVWSDGSVHHFVTRGKVIRSPSGEPEVMTGACLDITERKRLEACAGRVLVMQEREDFMATLTHDLRTPLLSANQLLGMYADGQHGPLSGELSEGLLQLKDSNNSVLSMIEDLLEVYRYEKGAYALKAGRTDLLKLISAVIQEMLPLAGSRGITLEARLPEAAPEAIMDGAAVKRVLINLLDNALKFSPTGGIVLLDLEVRSCDFEIRVSDSGPGIADSEKMRLFQRFSQGSAANRYRPGVGLGLYLCKQIAEAHGGLITVNSTPGQGATFIVRLPFDGRLDPDVSLKTDNQD